MTRARDVADTQDNTGGAVAPFVAGKNKIINGDFGIWQRGTSFTHTSAAYTADRFQGYSDASQSYSQQTFTPGTAPVAGYEGQFFWRGTKGATGTFISLYQHIEGVRAFAGQTFTVSFWAKADSNQTVYIRPAQFFGSGGSAVVVLDAVAVNITTSWTRVSATFNMPSISGKTIGTNSSVLIENYIINNGAVTWDVWGMQAENGRVVTPFTTASNTIGGELALCQRYYWRAKVASGFGTLSNYWFPNTTSLAYAEVSIPVPFRALPSAVEWGGNIGVSDGFNLIGGISSITVAGTTPFTTYVALTTNMSSSSLTVYRGYKFADQGAGTAFLALSAEL